MKLKYYEVQSLQKAFKDLEAIEGNFTIPGKISYHLHKNRCRIDDKWNQLENERKVRLTGMLELDKNGQPVLKKNKEGQDQMVFKDEEAFKKMFKEYESKSVTVGVKKIPFEDMIDEIHGEHEAMQHFFAIAETINNLLDNEATETTPNK